MKRILSLLVTLTLVNNCASFVISCNTKENNLDEKKANSIAQTLKTSKINPILLNIKNNKHLLSDYFISDIKKILDAKLTDKEKKYNYSLVNVNKITNISKNFNVKIKINQAISTVEFYLNVSFRYTKVLNDNIPSKFNAVYVMKNINNKVYVGTENGLFISNTASGKIFSKVNGPWSDQSIADISEIGSKVYVGAADGLYSGNGRTFTKITGILDGENIQTIKQINNKIYIGTMFDGLYFSNDLRSNNFQHYQTNIGNNFIHSIFGINNKIFLGIENGLFVSNSTTNLNFNRISGDLGRTVIKTIKMINNKMYVGTSLGIFISNNYTDFNQIPDFPIRSSVEDILKINNIIYVGTDNGFYISTDKDGMKFIKVTNKGFPDNTWVLSIQKVENKVYLGTLNKGLYYNFIS